VAKEADILQGLSEAVQAYDSHAAAEAARAATEAKVSPVKAIEEGLAVGLRVIGDKFEAGELWLPHLVLGAEAMEAAVKVLEEHMPLEELEATKRGTVVIGTVEGDLHDLGLRIVASMLRANGFKVHDLGCDTSSLSFIDKAKEANADIIAVSGGSRHPGPVQGSRRGRPRLRGVGEAHRSRRLRQGRRRGGAGRP
jgi:trimethylamine corrinoid protein